MCKKILLIIVLCLLTGCIEYRWEARNNLAERYFTVPFFHRKVSKKAQDPKVGSKGKLYLYDNGPISLYVGGHYSRNRLTGNLGVLYYPNETVSFEIGYRSLIYVADERFSDNSTRIDWHNDQNLEGMLYIGGRINFD